MFSLDSLYVDQTPQGFLVRHTKTGTPLFRLLPLPVGDEKELAAFVALIPFIAKMREALLDARATLLRVDMKQASANEVLVAIAHLNTPLSAIERIENWANAKDRHAKV